MLKRLCIAAVFAVGASATLGQELTVWGISAFTPAAPLPAIADAYSDLYARFEAENPGVTIKFEIIPGGADSLTHVLTAANSGNLPDLAVVDSSWIARLVETGKLQPLNDYWTEEARADFYPQVIDALTFDGNIYAAWFHNAWRGLFYRKDTLAGLGYENPPRSWDEFLEFAEAAKQAGMYAVMYPAEATEISPLHLIPMFWGLGGELVDESGRPIFFEGENRTALEEVYGMYRLLVERGYMPVDVATMSEQSTLPFFYTGESATSAQSSSTVQRMYADAPEFVGNLGAFNYPLNDGAVAVPILVGWTYGIFAEDQAKKDLSWKFIEFVLRPENLGQLNAAAGHMPVLRTVWEQDFFKNDALMSQFKAAFDEAGMRPRPVVPIYPSITAALSQQLADVLSGAITPAQAVDNARDHVMADYARFESR